MPKNILFDTGYWFALYDNSDSHHVKAESYLSYLSIHNVLIPWPSLYETLNTKFLKKDLWLFSFATLLKKSNVSIIDDVNYRSLCYQRILARPSSKRPISLVDLVIRDILLDSTIRIHSLISFNPNDFRDVCQKKGIELHD